MQKVITLKDLCLVTKTAQMAANVHGGRAKCLQRLIRLDMPVPTTVALSLIRAHKQRLIELHKEHL